MAQPVKSSVQVFFKVFYLFKFLLFKNKTSRKPTLLSHVEVTRRPGG
jgi:hypothetical protein